METEPLSAIFVSALCVLCVKRLYKHKGSKGEDTKVTTELIEYAHKIDVAMMQRCC